MTDGGYTKTEARNLQLQGQIADRDAEIARLTDEVQRLHIDYEHSIDDYNTLQSRYDCAIECAEEAEAQVVVLQEFVQRLARPDTYAPVWASEYRTEARELLASLPTRDGAIERAENLREALGEAVRILSFAFEDGALPEETVLGLTIDPYGALADMKAALTAYQDTAGPSGTPESEEQP